MAEFIDIVMYREPDGTFDSMFFKDEDDVVVMIGMWLPTDDVDKRILRIQRDEISNL